MNVLLRGEGLQSERALFKPMCCLIPITHPLQRFYAPEAKVVPAAGNHLSQAMIIIVALTRTPNSRGYSVDLYYYRRLFKATSGGLAATVEE